MIQDVMYYIREWGIVSHSLVTATWRLDLPSSITSMTSSGLDTKRSVQPWQWNSIKRHVCFMPGDYKNTVLYCVLSFLPWQMAPCSYLHGQPGWFWKLESDNKNCIYTLKNLIIYIFLNNLNTMKKIAFISPSSKSRILSM